MKRLKEYSEEEIKELASKINIDRPIDYFYSSVSDNIGYYLCNAEIAEDIWEDEETTRKYDDLFAEVMNIHLKWDND